MKTFTCSIFSILLFLLFHLSASAAIITVTNTNNSGAGSLRQAISTAASGDEIVFSNAINGSAIILDSVLTIATDLTITGNGMQNTIIDGGKNDRVFWIEGGISVSMSGLIVQNGQVVANYNKGGGILALGNLTMTNCWVRGNSVIFYMDPAFSYGGGISSNGNLVLINCIVSGNSAYTRAGGIYWSDGDITLINTTVVGNSAEDGAGIHFAAGSFHDLILRNSIVWANEGYQNPQVFGSFDIVTNSIVQDMDLTSQGSGNLDGTDPANDPNFIIGYKVNIPNTGGDYRITANSNLIDAGNNTYNTTSNDIYGVGRTFDGDLNGTSTIDIGAVEFNNYPGQFITRWDTRNPGSSADNQITIPTYGFGSYNYTVHWGDGTSTTTSSSTPLTHTYPFAPQLPVYNVVIEGTFPRILFNGGGDKDKILAVLNWGDNPWTSMRSAFKGCTNLTIETPWSPNLSNTSDLFEMFQDATSVNENLENWDVSNITNMGLMFDGATGFNGDIGDWDVSNVNTFSVMFRNATSFNRDIGSWNTGSGIGMGSMFQGATSFNRDIGNWDVGNVELFHRMFESATTFNQDIGNWDVSNATSFAYMFKDATSFDQDLGAWDISSLTSGSGSLAGCKFMFEGTGLSIANYDNLLIGWNRLDPGESNIPFSVEFHGGSSQYCAGEGAHMNLENNRLWTFTDGGSLVSYDTLDVETCSAYTVPSGDETYTMSGTYVDTIPNSAGCDSILIINLTVDQEPPVANCMDVTISLDANGSYTLTPQEVDNGSYDSCSTVNLSVHPINLGCSDLGNTSVVLTVTDENGNSNTCMASVLVEDNIPPTPVCRDVTVSLDENGEANLQASDIDGGSFDNCTIDSMYLDVTAFDCMDIGMQVVTLTANDNAGNSSSCMANVTVEDLLAPTVSCGGDVTLNSSTNGMGDCMANSGYYGSYTLGDNCPGLIQAREVFTNELGDTLRDQIFNLTAGTFTPFFAWPVGTNTATIIPIDASGNTGIACTYNVIVMDDEPPVANCQDITVQLDEQGQIELKQYSVGNVNGRLSLQNSGDPNLTTDCDCPTGYVAVGYEGFAGCIIDDFRLICKELMPDGSLGNTTAVTCFSSNGSSVNESYEFMGDQVLVGFEVTDVDYSYSSSRVLSEINGIGKSVSEITNLEDNSTQNTVLTGITGSGCFSSNAETSIQYAPAGHVIVGMSVNPNFGYTSSVRFRYAPVYNTLGVENGSTDNCGISNATISPSGFNCDDIGQQSVVYTVWDRFGNSSSCNATITVEDTIPPEIECQDITLSLNANGEYTYNVFIDGAIVSRSDNCGVQGSVGVTGPQTYTCNHLGDNMVTIFQNDVNGNTSTCNFNLTVIDEIPPMAVCQDITVNLDANGEVTVPAVDVDGGSTDNCGIISRALDRNTFECSDIGSNAVVMTVTDQSGNSSTCSATVTVQDNTAPTVFCQDITVSLDTDGNGSISVNDVDAGSFDNCGIASRSLDITDFDCSNVGDTTVTFTVTDENGLNSSCVVTITIVDEMPPTLVCQDVTIYLDSNGNGIWNPFNNGAIVELNDNCQIKGSGVLFGPIADYCNRLGNINYRIDWADIYDNLASCTYTATIQDTISPIAFCQDITVNLDANGQATVPAVNVDGGSTDNCSVTGWTLDQSTFDCNDIGSNIVVLTVTDESGNSSSCTATITVEDNVPPSPICEDVTISLDNNGNASLTAAEVDGGSFDNCSVSSISIDKTSFSCTDLGDQTVILTVTDQSGNSANCSATVTVEDNIAPTVSCLGDVNFNTSSNGSGDCTGFVGLTGGYTLSDNCPDAIQAQEIFINELGDTLRNIVFDLYANTWYPNAMWPAGTNTATIIPIDGSGNEGTACSYQVTVIDDEAPIANCQDITVQLDEQGEIDLNQYSVGDVNGRLPLQNSGDPNLTTDCDCPEDYVAVGYEGFAGCIVDEFRLICKELLPDGSLGNTTAVTCFSSGGSSVNETHVLTGDQVLVGFEVSDVDYSFTSARILSEVKGIGKSISQITNIEDNSTQNTMLSSIAGGGCYSSNEQTSTEYAPAGHVIVGMSVTGAGGYTPSVRFRYAPVSNTLAIDNGSTDNCEITNATLSLSDFDCDDVGDHTAVYTVWDRFGNSSSCSAVITVEDNVPPIALCRDATIFLDENGTAGITANETDNGSTDSCGIDAISLDKTSFDCSETGQNTVVLTVTDVNGNSSSCTAIVTVLDSVSPTALCRDITVELDANGEVEIDSSDIDNGSFDNCDISTMDLGITAFDCSNVGSNIVILTVTDESGNSSSCSASVTVEDNMPPTALCRDITIELDENGEAVIQPVDIDNGSFDNCEIESLALNETEFDCSEVGSNTVELTVTDVNGNESTCNANVMVEDNIPPTPICRDVTVQLDGNGQGSVVPSDIDNGSYDNCEIASLELDEMDFDCSEVGENVVVLTVTDVNGNIASCNATVTVEDNIPPVIISVPADITLECDQAIPGDQPIAEDNCEVIITHQDVTIPGRCTGEYMVRRTFTVVDPSGNEAAYKPVRFIQFIDTKVPYLISAPQDETIACGTVPTLTLPVVEDNCDPDPEITYTDVYREDPSCPQGGRIDRTFTISDDCGNSYELLQQFYFYDDVAPVIAAVHPDLIGLNNGGTLQYQCFAQDPNWEFIEFTLNDFNISDNCSNDIQSEITEEVVSNGDCMGDGYLAKIKYTVSADDRCGNTSSFEFYLELIDDISPVLYGIPSDLTISCEDNYSFPSIAACAGSGDVYAIDECECATIVETRDTIAGSCPMDFSVIVSYTATDNCGNTSTGSYTISVVDNDPPILNPVLPELANVTSGDILDVNCNNSNFPDWVQSIGPDAIIAEDNCGSTGLIDYSENVVAFEDCFDVGALAIMHYTWEFEDECGNTAFFEFKLRLVDNEAPVFQLNNEIICADFPIQEPVVEDNCGEVASLNYKDEEVIDNCSGENIILRTWTAVDYCGNIGTAQQRLVTSEQFDYHFEESILQNAISGDTILLECTELSQLEPAIEWLVLEDGCFGRGQVLSVMVTEAGIDSNCLNGTLRVDRWTWQVESVCGELSEIHILVNVIDQTAPELSDFENEIILACGEGRPVYQAEDICSGTAQVEEISFELIDGDTCQTNVYERILKATDLCGNEKEFTQMISIEAGQGPEITGIPSAAVCDVRELENVSAYDHCINSVMPVEFEDVLTEDCEGGRRTLRVYRAESYCGTESRDSVYIINNDQVPPDYQIVGEGLEGLMNGSIVEIECTGEGELYDIDVSADDVVFADACDPEVEVRFHESFENGNCEEDGYWRVRKLIWEAKDACGNVSKVNIEFRIVDTQAPEFLSVPGDVVIFCGDDDGSGNVIAVDQCSEVVEIDFSDGLPQVIDRGTLVERTWTASDGCGNSSSIVQNVIYDNAGMNCQITYPVIVQCDRPLSLSANVEGGVGPYTFTWHVTEGYADILSGQGSSNVLLDLAFSNTEITVLVEDQRGCISSCSIQLSCSLGREFRSNKTKGKWEYHLYQNVPNPFANSTIIGFELPKNANAQIVLYDNSGKEVHSIEGAFKAGYNEVLLNNSDLPAAGMYYYEFRSGSFKGVKQFVLIE